MEQFYDAGQLAELFHKKKDTVRKMIARGDFGETFNPGRQRLVSEKALKDYVAAHTGASDNRQYDMHTRHKRRMVDCMAKI